MTGDEILEATLELACEKGLGRVTMSQIADRVHLKKASLYSHFKSKDDIIESMYTHFRDKAMQQSGSAEVDYGKMVSGHTLKEILTTAVASYKQINSDPDMDRFYRMIMSERSVDPAAAAIMVEETEKMITATKNLFYAISAKGVAHFPDPDAAAFSFAMGVHAVIEYECDSKHAEIGEAAGMMDTFIDEFCRVYGNKP